MMDADDRSCAQLWCAVIMQLIEDATSNAPALHNERRDARRWFLRKGADFCEVCALAGLDAEAVQSRALKLIAEEDAINPPGTPQIEIRKKKTRLLAFKGQTHNLTDWARVLGFKRHVLASRLKSGWTVEATLSTPLTIRCARPKAKADGARLRPARSRPAERPARKKRVGRRVSFNGESLTVVEWAERLGLKKHTLEGRFRAGIPVEIALTPGAFRPGRRSAEALRKVSIDLPPPGGGSKLLENARDRRGSVTQDSV